MGNIKMTTNNTTQIVIEQAVTSLLDDISLLKNEIGEYDKFTPIGDTLFCIEILQKNTEYCYNEWLVNNLSSERVLLMVMAIKTSIDTLMDILNSFLETVEQSEQKDTLNFPN
jgi:hypothetical protein